jgi:MoxR-like ATPase
MTAMTLDTATPLLQRLRAEVSKVLVGQQEFLDQVLIGLLADGHVLVEGVPGLGKTLLVKTLAKTLHTQFSRIQFTPDLMPSDITGHAMFNMASQQFDVRKGPVFTNLLLADEINRAPAKTQAALLEVMQERQVTIEGVALATGSPFLVLATQNPVEQDGTYPLPEAELDRFLMKILLPYPSAADELVLAQRFAAARAQTEFSLDDVQIIASEQELKALQQLVRDISLSAEVLEYIVRIVRASRDWPGLARGAGPRATLSLIGCSKAYALLMGSSFVIPDFVKTVALPVLRHRVQLSAEMVIEVRSADTLLSELLKQVPAPKQ